MEQRPWCGTLSEFSVAREKISIESSQNTGERPYLPHDSALKHNKHKECEETVVPILVETPKGNAEDLEDKERCCGVFREQFREGGDGNVKLVLSILHYKHFGIFLRESLGLPEGGDGRLVCAWVSQRTKCNRVRV